MKFAADRPCSDPEKAARKLLEIANSVEVVQDGRIYIELINGPFLFRERATPAEYSAGLKLAIERGWLRCTRAEPMSSSRKRAPICSLEIGTITFSSFSGTPDGATTSCKMGRLLHEVFLCQTGSF